MNVYLDDWMDYLSTLPPDDLVNVSSVSGLIEAMDADNAAYFVDRIPFEVAHENPVDVPPFLSLMAERFGLDMETVTKMLSDVGWWQHATGDHLIDVVHVVDCGRLFDAMTLIEKMEIEK